MNIIFLGGRQAGCIGLLTLKAMGHSIPAAVCYDDNVRDIALRLGVPRVFQSAKHVPMKMYDEADLLVSVHGREILPKIIFDSPARGALNVHPCLSRYPGKNPVKRLLKDGETMASVGVHRMTEVLDSGEVVKEVYVDVEGKRTVDEVYNALYPVYSIALMEAVNRIERI